MIFFHSYDLEPINIDGRIKEALKELKVTHPGISAVLMGTRRSDPYSGNYNIYIYLNFSQKTIDVT